jgi:glycosyltransferase involved in cell wall biosynthesis
MRILLINHEFTVSGASQMLFRVARHLLATGHGVDVVPLLPTEGPLGAMYAAIGASVVPRVKASLYQLCIANTIYAGPVVAELAGAMRIVWWIHESDNGLKVALANSGAYERAFQGAARILFPAARLGTDVYRSFLYQVPPERILAIANGVEPLGDVRPENSTRACRVVCIGSVYPLKRQGDLIEALEALDHPDLEAVFVGALSALSERGLAIAEADRRRATSRFKFLGALAHEQTMRWLASADIFVHPSESEGHPLAPLEAGLLGKPVVLADIAAHEGTWRHGHNCLMYPVGDVPLLAILLDGLRRDPELRRRLGERANATARRFSIQGFLREFDRLVLAESA